ncbi:MAG: cytochrome P460 family protein [Kiloniellales bacterium]
MNHPTTRASLAFVAAATLIAGFAGVHRGDGGAAIQTARAEVDITRPQRHFKVRRPAILSDAEALIIYDQILDELVRGYGLSGLGPASAYANWRRYNKTPYRSATHGNRYVSNYANAVAATYGEYERSGTMPQGSILAKDSFAATTRGEVTIGPLFLMEKMQPGFNPMTGDWRYTMIMPDGSIFGITNGEGSMRVKFCADCHKVAGAAQDYRYFVPRNYRRKFLDIKTDGE